MSKPFTNEDTARLRKVARAIVDTFKECDIRDQYDRDASIRVSASMTGIPFNALKEKCDEYIRADDSLRE